MINFFARHPTAANLLMLAIVAAGVFSLRGIRRETFPDYQPREVRITVPYPGATAGDVEESVLTRIEDALDGVRFVEEVRGDARDNIAIVTIEMSEGGDWFAFKDEIDTAMSTIDDFPAETEEPIIEELYTTEPVLTVIVTGEMSPADLKLYAEGLKDRLQQVPGVAMVKIAGFSEHQLRVELSSAALVRHGLSASDVAAAIARQSLDLPAGTVQAQGEEVLVRFSEERSTPAALAELVILGGEQGAEIRLADLGKVVDDFKHAEELAVLYDGPSELEPADEPQPSLVATHHSETSTATTTESDDFRLPGGGRRAALLQIEKTDSQDSLVVADAVRGAIDRERIQHPAVDLTITADISVLVADRLQMLTKNGLQGMLLVFAVMWLFFNTRLSFWVVASLPVSFLGALFFLPQLDITINMLSMVGLLLGIGILMDDGIVIAENIATHCDRGKPPLQAAIDGVAEVKGGVISSFLTTVCVLGPLAFLAGTIGRVLEVVPMILLVVLAVSLVEAFLILPNHLAHSLRPQSERNRFRARIDGGLDWFRNRVLGRSVDALIRWRYAWIGITIAIFLCSVALPVSGLLKFQALPELDGDTVVARVLMPQGTSLEQTEAVVERLVEAVRRVDRQYTPEQPDGRQLVQTTYARYNENADAFEAGPHVVTVYVDLLAAQDRTLWVDEFLAAWRREAGVIANAVAVNFTEPTRSPTGRNIEIRVRGNDLHELREVSLETRRWLSRFPGVDNLTTDLRPGKREYQLRFRPGTFGLELDSANMAGQLRAAFEGQKAAEIQVGSESYEIEARFDELSQDSWQDLRAFRFTLPDGTQTPLSAVATIEETRGWSRIARVDGIRTATLRGDVDSRATNTAAVLAAFSRKLIPEITKQHPGVQIELEGEVAETAITRGSLGRGLLVGVIGIFILLSFQFRSYVEPIIVMTAIPLALVGVIWGHVLMGFPLTMPSLVGFVSLAGIVVNDSILLVLFLKSARLEGKDPQAAASQASRERFRAILITSLTTIAGLIPLTFETSLQAQILIPLAVSVVFGLLASTVLVLLVIPCLYVILDDFGWTARLGGTSST